MTDFVVFAYIDPGTGSYLLQMTLAGMLGAGYAVRRFWTRIRGLFARAPSEAGVGDGGEAGSDDASR
jgi:hypothetical protein